MAPQLCHQKNRRVCPVYLDQSQLQSQHHLTRWPLYGSSNHAFLVLLKAGRALADFVRGVVHAEVMSAAWTRTRRVGFDTETTGVDPTTARIVTAALVIRVPNTLTEVKTWLLNPGVEIPPESTAIHGITTAHAQAHGRDPAEALDEIANELASHLLDEAPVVAFNAAYDLPLLDVELERYGLPTLPQRVGRADYPVLDPLVLDRWVDRYRKGKRTLVDLTNHYQVSVTEALHDAVVDTIATLDVLEEMSRLWPQIGVTELHQLRPVQANAHREWASNFNDWLRKQGSVRSGPSLDWL